MREVRQQPRVRGDDRAAPGSLRDGPAFHAEEVPTRAPTPCLGSDSTVPEALLSPFPSLPTLVWHHLWCLSGPDSDVPLCPQGNVAVP